MSDKHQFGKHGPYSNFTVTQIQTSEGKDSGVLLQLQTQLRKGQITQLSILSLHSYFQETHLLNHPNFNNMTFLFIFLLTACSA